MKGEAGIDETATTLVHEASHKWSETTDVLYKHQTFAKFGHASAIDDPEAAEAIHNENQPIYSIQAEVPGRRIDQDSRSPKEFRPMAGFEKINPNRAKLKNNIDTSQLIEDERWLENADSYAWFARRMWKRSNSK